MPLDRNEKLAACLDGFLDDLRAGRMPRREQILAEFPEVQATLHYLEELERRAQVATENWHPAENSLPRSEEATLNPLTDSNTQSLAEPSLQTRFGKYELLSLLGRGGMGVVYKARQIDLNRTVALKMIVGSQLASAQHIARFESEARLAAGLRHPHILPIFDAGQHRGQRYFAMQYVEGPTLGQRLRQAPPSFEAAAGWLSAVARAVGYLHDHKIVHRDLKPANILLDENNHPYVTDFGIVKVLEADSNLTATGDVVGTPSYMAPEQAAGNQSLVGPRSDVYSLGAILYEMLTLRPPFLAQSPFETLVQVIEGEPTLPRQLNPGIPRRLELICLKAMAKNPAERYASAAALADDLERFLRNESVSAQPQNPRQRVSRWVRQEPGLAIRLILLSLTAGIAQIYYGLYHPVSLQTHAWIMGVLGAWAGVALLCQFVLRRDLFTDVVRRAWLAADTLFLTIALIVDGAFVSPLILAYGVLIVASGLWFRVSLVWFTTAFTLLGYATLIGFGGYVQGLGESPQHHVIVAVALIGLGIMVGTQVRRVRALSRYYENRPLP